MTEPRELLAQAKHLVRLDARRPKQTNLRTAVSRAYYALFHLLAQDGARMLIRGRDSSVRELRATLTRCFEHKVMANASRAFAGRGKNAWLTRGRPVPRELVEVSEAFIELQEARNLADYDMNHRLTRSTALSLVAVCQRAFAVWPQIRKTSAGQSFLLALLLRPRA